ncbi:hypothetical protein ACKC9G_18535 [Pokkaliibacter sp. CJK22405]|uniref:hypothetical protein n=1 Tax=Pokkaliibacter sp. CJK22405 TaxID=3384615 RepID=UPI0039855DE7
MTTPAQQRAYDRREKKRKDDPRLQVRGVTEEQKAAIKASKYSAAQVLAAGMEQLGITTTAK